MKKMLNKMTGLAIVACLILSQGVIAFAAVGQNLQNAAANTDMDHLSGEYITSDGWRISVVAYEDASTEEGYADAFGFIYYKGQYPYLDSAFEGTIDKATSTLEATWYSYYGDAGGDMVLDFDDSGTVIKGDGAWDSETFTFTETARSKYAEKEIAELSEEYAAYASGEEEFNPGNPIPNMYHMLSTEYRTTVDTSGTDSYNFVMFAADPATLETYGLSTDYEVVGAIYQKGNVGALFDSIMVGNLVETDSAIRFEGYWAQSESVYSPMYIDFKVRIATDESGEGYYMVTGTGSWWNDDSKFALAETARSKYAKREAQEVEEEVLAYLASNEEEISSGIEEAEVEEVMSSDEASGETSGETTSTTDNGTCAGFDDVPADYIYCDAITYARENGIVNGYPDNTFRPENTINRAELTKVMIESTVSDEEIESCVREDKLRNNLSDVPRSEWFRKYVCTAYDKGIVQGYPGGEFKPLNAVNFAEESKIVVNSFEMDVCTSTVWYEPYATVLDEENAIPQTVDAVDAYMTRGETVQVIYTMLAGIEAAKSPSYEDLGGENGILTCEDTSIVEDEVTTVESEDTDAQVDVSEDTDFSVDADTEYLFMAEMSGSHEVPAADSLFLGSIELRVVGGNYVDYVVTLNDPLGVLADMTAEEINAYFTGAHLHMGAADETGSVIHTMPLDLEYDGVSSYEIVGSWSNVEAQYLEALFDGNVYVNLHTVDNPDGEIRGQLELELVQ